MIKKDYVYVSAFLKGNLGDDLFLKVLFDMFPSVKFKILAEKNYAYQFLHYSNVKLINYGRIKKLLNRLFAKLFNLNIFEFFLIKNSKVDLRIAGSIFIEQPGWKKKINIQKRLISNNSLIIGCNFGPYSDFEYFVSQAELLKKCYCISWRDKWSYDLFKYPNMQYAPDFVFNLKNDNEKIKTDSKRIIINCANVTNVVGLKYNYNEYIIKMAMLTEDAIKKGYSVELVAFCSAFLDLKACKDVFFRCSKQAKERIEIFEYNNNINEALNHFQKSKFVLSTRFHGMILGFLMKKKVFPIIYTSKQINELLEIGYSGEYCWINQINNLSFDYFIKEAKELDNLADVVQDANKHIQVIMRTFKEKGLL